LEFNVPFQHKYGYIRDDITSCTSPTLSLPAVGGHISGNKAYKECLCLSQLSGMDVEKFKKF